MRSRIKQLHYDYCAEKPKCFVDLVDTEIQPYAETNEDEENSIDVYCHLVV